MTGVEKKKGGEERDGEKMHLRKRKMRSCLRPNIAPLDEVAFK